MLPNLLEALACSELNKEHPSNAFTLILRNHLSKLRHITHCLVATLQPARLKEARNFFLLVLWFPEVLGLRAH